MEYWSYWHPGSVPLAIQWVTSVLGKLVESGKLNIHTHTTVQSITDRGEDDFAVIHTQRENIIARNVVHATNAWLGHVLPELQPYISPVRGDVVHYGAAPGSNAHSSVLGFDHHFSYWLRYGDKYHDYLIRRKEGDIVV